MNSIATRQAFGETLQQIMKEDSQTVALTADLGESLRMIKIREEIPERFLDTGVAEANMSGIAAGLATQGFIPFAGTFAVFLTRAFDHIRVQVCQNNLHVILVGSHGGVSNALDGGTANALEDIAYMRTLPNMTIVFPVDANQTRHAVRAVKDYPGPVYLRLYREPTPVFTNEEDDFDINKANTYRTGEDISIIASGPQTAYALQAAEDLEKEGISAEVVGISTIAPLDVETIITSAKKTKRVLTVEDHSINGGLGSTVAETLGEHNPVPLSRLGLKQFGESGKYDELIKKLGIDKAGIKDAAMKIINQT